MAILFATATSDGSPITFKLVRGTRWTDTFQLTDQATGLPIDLTGETDIFMRVRTARGADPVILELSITNGYLTVTDEQTGTVAIDVPSAITNSSFPKPSGNKKRDKYVYDALIERSAGEYEAAIAGKVVVDHSVTRKLDDTP